MGRHPAPHREPVFCSVPGCSNRAKHLTLVLCNAHYLRHRSGDVRPEVPVAPTLSIPHGTIRGYTDFACRCEHCREANRVSCRTALLKRFARPVPADRHGTAKGYFTNGCRCGDCRQAGRDYRRRARASRKERVNG